MRRLASVVALVLVVGACSGGGHHRAAPTTTAPPRPVAFVIRGVDVQSTTSTPATLSADLQAQVLASLNRYLDLDVVGPLKTGTAAPDAASVFSAGAAPRLAGPDRAALVDEGGAPQPVVQAPVADAQLTVLAGPDHKPVVVTAALDLQVEASGAPGAPATDVVRRGQLLLVPEAGQWLIDGYDLSVTRSVAGGPTTTTTAVHK